MAGLKELPESKSDSQNLRDTDKIAALIWEPAMGLRLKTIRMKNLVDQGVYAKKLGISVASVSKLEAGGIQGPLKDRNKKHLTIAHLRFILMFDFNYVVFGSNPNRYDPDKIHIAYWDFVLRTNRKNARAERLLLNSKRQSKLRF